MSAFTHTPNAWLYAYIQTTTPGHKTVTIGGTSYEIADTGPAGVVWPEFVSALSSAIIASGWSATIQSTGAVLIGGPSATLAWPDGLGRLLGMACQPGTSFGTTTGALSQVVPYGGIPLYGATWESVRIERDVRFEVSRMARSHGYIYGGARLWEWRLTCTHHALRAIRRGFVLNRKVRIQGSDASAMSSSNADGYLEGWPLGITGVQWLDKVQRIAEVTLLVTSGGV